MRRPDKFKIHRFDFKNNSSKYRFNLDYPEDYEFLKKIFEYFYPKNKDFQIDDVIEWLEKNPNIFEINTR